MKDPGTSIDFTGEFFVPGKSGQRIEADHMERYHFACRVAQGKSILDIACGLGYSAPLLIGAGAVSYDGVDISEKLVNYADSAYGSNRARYHVGDICSFNNGKRFDMITCYETIEHVKDYELAIGNLCKLLTRGGRLLISSPNRDVTSPSSLSLHDKPANKFHMQEFTPEELLSILNRHGFSASRNDVYGQRQRRAHSNVLLRAALRMFGNPDITTSAVVTPVSSKVPRYFVIVAAKCDE